LEICDKLLTKGSDYLEPDTVWAYSQLGGGQGLNGH